MPDTDVVQYANMTNSYFTCPANQDSSKYSPIVISINTFGTPRPAYVYFTGNVFENIENTPFQTIYFVSGSHVEIFIENNIFRNINSVTSTNSFIIAASSIWFTNNTFENIYNPGNRLIYIYSP
jgi:hypothetical protein